MLKNSLRAAAVLALIAAVAAPVAVAAPAPEPPPLRVATETLRSSLKGEARREYPVAEEEVRFSVEGGYALKDRRQGDAARF
ncbi:hypothetical protein AB0D99_26825 [Streptomyces sp. NPDC047971]|uniref:hypothetical protein n=1 Tax=Streptomyces sp. NPDC047971 TaxID=3154499 RepID=UPI0033CCC505